MMRLSRLLDMLDGFSVTGAGDPEVTDLTSDSRAVRPGALFAALPGVNVDGRAFVQDAVAAGAVAVLVRDAVPGCAVPQILADDVRVQWARLAEAFFGRPSRSLALCGITGTNGKTTIATLMTYLLRAAGRRVGQMGTILYDNGVQAVPAPLTTPDTVAFARCLAEMVAHGCTDAVVEVSSHALCQERVGAHRFAVGVFTNLTRDHLDYHGDMDAYADAKKRLFDGLDADAAAVVNADDAACAHMVCDCGAPVVRYGLDAPDADWRASVEESTVHGTRFMLSVCGDCLPVESPLVGRHNVYNTLAALAGCEALGLPVREAADSLRGFPGVPGRLERFSHKNGAVAFVDYAHTDDALRSVLRVLRPLTQGQLWVVFGCGGDRDRGKRPLMAQAAEDEADKVVVTQDNPRTEDPAQILNDILTGFRAPESVEVIQDRREAISHALKNAQTGDVVLVAGKGHEDYQIIGTTRYPFDDREVVCTVWNEEQLS